MYFETFVLKEWTHQATCNWLSWNSFIFTQLLTCGLVILSSGQEAWVADPPHVRRPPSQAPAGIVQGGGHWDHGRPWEEDGRCPGPSGQTEDWPDEHTDQQAGPEKEGQNGCTQEATQGWGKGTVIQQLLLSWYFGQQRVRVRVMIGFWVQGRVGIKIKIRVGVRFNVSVYHWSNCRRSKWHTVRGTAEVWRPFSQSFHCQNVKFKPFGPNSQRWFIWNLWFKLVHGLK